VKAPDLSWGDDPRLAAEVADHPYPLLFATVSGAHLYGFPSPDSDFDLRGVHVLPLEEVVGLGEAAGTVDQMHMRDGAEVDLVTHDIRKFFTLLLRSNGYVLEQLYSPLVVRTTEAHAELKAISRGCINASCHRHYAGFARNQWQMFSRQEPKRLKTLLYVYRVLLTGIHLLRTGEVNANLLECNEEIGLPFLPELVARKQAGGEKDGIRDLDFDLHEREVTRLRARLDEEAQASRLPAEPSGHEDLNDLLLRVRLGGRSAS
jgi:predicted nucleotidyltransferase